MRQYDIKTTQRYLYTTNFWSPGTVTCLFAGLQGAVGWREGRLSRSVVREASLFKSAVIESAIKTIMYGL